MKRELTKIDWIKTKTDATAPQCHHHLQFSVHESRFVLILMVEHHKMCVWHKAVHRAGNGEQMNQGISTATLSIWSTQSDSQSKCRKNDQNTDKHNKKSVLSEFHANTEQDIHIRKVAKINTKICQMPNIPIFNRFSCKFTWTLGFSFDNLLTCLSLHRITMFNVFVWLR